MRFLSACVGVLLVGSHVVQSINLDVKDPASIKLAASQIAYDLINQHYNGNQSGQIPGVLPAPYFWWEAGAMIGSLIDYQYYTKDTAYSDLITQAMLFQANTPYNDYKPLNQSKSLGNDDQGFWGMAAMRAAETGFPNPPKDSPQWLALAQAVFNTQAIQYDVPPSTCGGGLRWQIFEFNNGYHYKNSISNGIFFNLGARLARYTGNTTYSDWAEKTYSWVEEIGLLTADGSVFDGTDEGANCTVINNLRWTYNVGVYLLGAANMYNYTASIDPNGASAAKWRERTLGLVNATSFFFNGANVMYEQQCEPSGQCDTDQRSFKAYLARWMAATTQVAPFTYQSIQPKLATSALAAAAACSGSNNGRTCGLKWTDGNWDGSIGVGEQMAALEVVQVNLVQQVSAPVTNSTGGTSPGNPNAGTGASLDPTQEIVVTVGGRIGAGVMTTVIVLIVIGGVLWMNTDITESVKWKVKGKGYSALRN